MKKYLVKEYKVYTLDYYVKAKSKKEALRIFETNEGDIQPDLDSLSFVENTENYGIPIEGWMVDN